MKYKKLIIHSLFIKAVKIILIAFIFIPDLSASTKIDKDKKTIINTLEAHKDRLIEISDNIWEAAEPALLEFKSQSICGTTQKRMDLK